MTELAAQHCTSCTRETPTLRGDELQELRAALSDAWTVSDDQRHLQLGLRVSDFAAAFALATRIALLAESEGHDPDLRVGWGHLEVDLTTHAAGGLTRNDLIMAAKIDRLPR